MFHVEVLQGCIYIYIADIPGIYHMGYQRDMFVSSTGTPYGMVSLDVVLFVAGHILHTYLYCLCFYFCYLLLSSRTALDNKKYFYVKVGYEDAHCGDAMRCDAMRSTPKILLTTVRRQSCVFTKIEQWSKTLSVGR